MAAYYTVDDFSTGLDSGWDIVEGGFEPTSDSYDGDGSVRGTVDEPDSLAANIIFWDEFGYTVDDGFIKFVYKVPEDGTVDFLFNAGFRSSTAGHQVSMSFLSGKTQTALIPRNGGSDYAETSVDERGEWVETRVASSDTGFVEARTVPLSSGRDWSHLTSSETGDLYASPNEFAVVTGGTETLIDSVEVEYATPTTPQNLSAAFSSDSYAVGLDWDYSSQPYERPSRFDILRATTPGETADDYERVGTANTESYSDAELADDTTYYYRVQAVNLAGESGVSNETTATADIYPEPVREVRVVDAETDTLHRVSLADPGDTALEYNSIRTAVDGQVLAVDVVPPTDNEAIESHRLFHPVDGVLCPRAFDSVM